MEYEICCYANNDLKRKEVRVELGWFPDSEKFNGFALLTKDEAMELLKKGCDEAGNEGFLGFCRSRKGNGYRGLFG